MAGGSILSNIRRRFVQAEWGQIHIRLAGVDTGEKPPLVCLHMAPQSGKDFEAFLSGSRNERLVIAPDYYGYGDSDKLPQNIVATIEIYAQAIWQVLDEMGIEQVDILGHHTGSKVAIEMAVQRPAAVRKMMCIALSTMSVEDYSKSSPDFPELSEAQMGDGFGNWWRQLKTYYDPKLPVEVLLEKFAVSLKSGTEFSSGFAASHLYNAHVLAKLQMLKTPVVLVNPNDDLRETTPRAAPFIENCQLIEKPLWVPGFLDTQTDDVLAAVEQAFPFLNNLSSKRNTALAMSLKCLG